MQNIEQYSFSGKKTLVRVDFNVPLNDQFQITDDTRIRAAIPTIEKIAAQGGKVILMSHLGRPKNGPEDAFSLKHLASTIHELTGRKIHFAADCIGETAENAVKEMDNGDVLLLENLRFHKEEEKGDREFAKKLAHLGDVYVNDAFGTAHRAHASTAVIAEFFPNDKLFGYVMNGEIEAIDKLLQQAPRPFTAVMGGAKVSSKISVIKNVIQKVDHLIIGGGMTFTFIKALGGEVGNSLVEEDKLDLALELMEYAKERGVKIHLPVDSVCANKFANDAETAIHDVYHIPSDWMALDIGPKTEELFETILMASKSILWNGPMGVFEMSSFEHGTRAVGEFIAEATEAGSFSLVGGGDSVAAVNQFGLADRVSYVSTGGGALIEYMEGVELPGVKAIRG